MSYLASGLLAHLSTFEPPPFQVDRSHHPLLSCPHPDLFPSPLSIEANSKEPGEATDADDILSGRPSDFGLSAASATAATSDTVGRHLREGSSSSSSCHVSEQDSPGAAEASQRPPELAQDGSSTSLPSARRVTLPGSACHTMYTADGSLQPTSVEGPDSDYSRKMKTRRVSSPAHPASRGAEEKEEEEERGGLVPCEGRSEATFVSCAAGTSSFLSIPDDFLDIARNNQNQKLFASKSKNGIDPSSRKWNQCYHAFHQNGGHLATPNTQPCKTHHTLLRSSPASPLDDGVLPCSHIGTGGDHQACLNQTPEDATSNRDWIQKKKTTGWNTELGDLATTTGLEESVLGVCGNSVFDNEEEVSSRRPTLGPGRGATIGGGGGGAEGSRVSWSLLQPTHYGEGHSLLGVRRTSETCPYGLLGEGEEGEDALKEKEEENVDENGASPPPPSSEDAMETVWKSLADLKANVDIRLSVESVKVKCVSIYFTFEEIHLGFKRM